jgi:hypothetical protein
LKGTILYKRNGGDLMALPAKRNRPTKISIRQYVDNPYRGSSFLASRKFIKSGLNQAFIELLQKYRNLFYAVPYKYANGDVLFHVKVPSEEYKFNKIVYDVLFKISFAADKRYSLRDMKVFANSPSFLFTYAYVYYHEDIMIDEYADKIPGQALTTPPDVRNPVESLGFEKITYIAARYILDGQTLTDQYINRFGKSMTQLEEMNLSQKIADPNDIVNLYSLGRELQVKDARKTVNKERRAQREKLRQSYVEKQRKNKPQATGFLVKRKPRAKITARSAKRTLM